MPVEFGKKWYNDGDHDEANAGYDLGLSNCEKIKRDNCPPAECNSEEEQSAMFIDLTGHE